MVNKCCCCIPLRMAVLLIAILSALCSAAVLSYLIADRNNLLLYDDSSQVNLGAALYTGVGIAALSICASIFGIVGAITKKRNLIRIFKYVYWMMAILIVAVSVATWIFVLVKRNELQDSCMFYYESDHAETMVDESILSEEAEDVCSKMLLGILVGGGIAVVVANAIKVYFACIINAYTMRLKRSRLHRPLRDLEQVAAYKTDIPY
ncbi:predicted protein [Lichtheimia corymbifera JMRC:FSU:9682]|uniref:Uncharacterized protein n=1 Tax=Lichtheimia corymbifera JMRC:FSU:9682 TaxID=1263082 RepID=A0A068S253_9FUNG|nr:predicted protein [Lichtheimia corymbifera JMRC:FSU:9682]